MHFSKKAKLAALAALATASSMAQAAIPAAVGTTVTGIQSDASGMFDIVFPAVGAVVGLVVVIKLFKRFSSKI